MQTQNYNEWNQANYRKVSESSRRPVGIECNEAVREKDKQSSESKLPTLNSTNLPFRVDTWTGLPTGTNTRSRRTL